MFNDHPNLLHLLPVCLIMLAAVQHANTHFCTMEPNTKGCGTLIAEVTFTSVGDCFRECLASPECHGVTISQSRVTGEGCQLIGSDFETSFKRFWKAAPISCFNHSISHEVADSDEDSHDWPIFGDHTSVLTAIRMGENPSLYLLGIGAAIVVFFIVIISCVAMNDKNMGSPIRTIPANNIEDEVVINELACAYSEDLPTYTEAIAEKEEEDLPPCYTDVVVVDVSE